MHLIYSLNIISHFLVYIFLIFLLSISIYYVHIHALIYLSFIHIILSFHCSLQSYSNILLIIPLIHLSFPPIIPLSSSHYIYSLSPTLSFTSIFFLYIHSILYIYILSLSVLSLNYKSIPQHMIHKHSLIHSHISLLIHSFKPIYSHTSLLYLLIYFYISIQYS